MIRIVICCLLLSLAACNSNNEPEVDPRAPVAATNVPPRFSTINQVLEQARFLVYKNRFPEVRALSNTITDQGLALIKARMPNDLRRADVPRYEEGRRAFGEALKQWTVAVQDPSDAVLYAALERLYNAQRGWADAYVGRAVESAI